MQVLERTARALLLHLVDLQIVAVWGCWFGGLVVRSFGWSVGRWQKQKERLRWRAPARTLKSQVKSRRGEEERKEWSRSRSFDASCGRGHWQWLLRFGRDQDHIHCKCHQDEHSYWSPFNNNSLDVVATPQRIFQTSATVAADKDDVDDDDDDDSHSRKYLTGDSSCSTSKAMSQLDLEL